MMWSCIRAVCFHDKISRCALFLLLEFAEIDDLFCLVYLDTPSLGHLFEARSIDVILLGLLLLGHRLLLGLLFEAFCIVAKRLVLWVRTLYLEDTSICI